MGELSLLGLVLDKLREQRGDMGDMGEEEFSEEELKILGEDESDEFEETEEKEEEKEAEGEAQEEKEEEEEEEEQLDSSQKRIDELTAKSKTSEEKLDLFKTLGSDGYYKMYPDEKPEAEEEDEKPAGLTKALFFKQSSHLVVRGGKYDGKTLGDVRELDPDAADDFYLDWRDAQKDVQRSQETQNQKQQEEAQQELDNFGNSLTSRLFEKESIDELDKAQRDQVNNIVSEMLSWMDETNRRGYNLEDAYFILNREDLINDAKGKAIASVIKQAKTSQENHDVSARRGSGGTKTGYGAIEGMSREDLGDKLEAMTDVEHSKFMKNAPDSLKQKYPEFPWD